MSLTIKPVKKEAGLYEMPNGFWPAFCVETPIAELMGCHYTERGTIWYEHDGYVGALIEEEMALMMYEVLVDYVNTDEYTHHRYFGERKSQMEQMLKFLPLCGGFRMIH